MLVQWRSGSIQPVVVRDRANGDLLLGFALDSTGGRQSFEHARALQSGHYSKAGVQPLLLPGDVFISKVGFYAMAVHHIFVSHAWSYRDAYERLIKLLDAATNFTYRDFSVPKDDPIHAAPNTAALRAAIEAQMSRAGVVLILAGVYATYSKWINIEIDIAKRNVPLRKPIIAIEPWGSEKTSQVVKNAADEIVGWNTKSIVSAIRKWN